MQRQCKRCIKTNLICVSDGLELRDALFYAVECEFYEAIELLLEKDPQTNAQIVPGTTSPFEPGLTPFMLSANKNNYKILSMLYK